MFLYKCIHNLVALDLNSCLIPKTRPSRHCNSLSSNIPVETTTYIQKSFIPLTITQWNHLPEFIVKSSTLDVFKEGVCGIASHKCLTRQRLYLWWSNTSKHPPCFYPNCTHPFSLLAISSSFYCTLIATNSHKHTFRANNPWREGGLILPKKKSSVSNVLKQTYPPKWRVEFQTYEKCSLKSEMVRFA